MKFFNTLSASLALFTCAFAAPATEPVSPQSVEVTRRNVLPYPRQDFADCIDYDGPVQKSIGYKNCAQCPAAYPGRAVNCRWFSPGASKDIGNSKIEVWVDNYQGRIFEDAYECLENGRKGLMDRIDEKIAAEGELESSGMVRHVNWQGPYACKLEFWWS